jgi:23S rRNA (cytosine1962-C5)-methyltransferase
MSSESIVQLLEKAIQVRTDLFDSKHESAFRLFNGFSEGYPELVLEIYARTLVLHNYANDSTGNQILIQDVIDYLKSSMTWLRAGTLKARNGKTQVEKNGTLVFGTEPDIQVKEHGVWYAVDLTINRDTSFYLDTCHLRKWLIENMQGKSVLNSFAYTGSLGVAALAGGAIQVLQHDLHRKFLNIAKTSYTLNGFPVHKQDFIAADFFPTIAKLKSTKQSFDSVILDPPFFSRTSRGKVDQEKDSARLINKVRPLINDGGYLIAINNALYVSGREYLQTLEDLCQDGYLKIEEIIPVPEDCTGYNIVGKPITDPSPFNHSTKIAVLKVHRKPFRVGRNT